MNLTEAQRNLMLHERIAVLEGEKRGLNELDAARRREIAELKALVRDLWQCYDFATRGRETAQKMRVRNEIDRLGVNLGGRGRQEE